MSMPMTSATSGSSVSRCTTSAPHQRATPVTRTRRFLAIRSIMPDSPDHPGSARSTCPVSPDYPGEPGSVRSFDDVALHEDDGPRYGIEQRRLRLAQRELELAEQRVHRLHRLDRVADVDVG